MATNIAGFNFSHIKEKFACIVLNRLLTLLEDFLSEEQYGFHANWETMEIIFFL